MTRQIGVALALCVAVVFAACEDDLAEDAGDVGADVPQLDPTIDLSVLDGLPAVAPGWDPDGESFFSMPWPADNRVYEDGRVDLSDFPNSQSGLVQIYASVIEENVRGFSLMPIIYVQLDQEIDQVAIPTPDETLDIRSEVQLIDVSEDGCGERIPVEGVFYAEGERYRDPNMLAMKPVNGFILRANTTYALVVMRTMGVDEGMQVSRPQGFDRALRGEHDDIELNALYEPLRACGPTAPLDLDAIAIATVFTTQDPVEETRRIRDFVMDPNVTDPPEITGWRDYPDRTEDGDFITYGGDYETPIFQRGDSPYADEGGGFVFAEDGTPEVQRWETVPVTATFPDDGSDGPYPVLIFVDGTGASRFGHVRDDHIQQAIDAGIAVVSFLPQFHGERATPGSDPVQHGFNYLNPESGRTTFRQQVIDTSYLIRVIREALPSRPGVPALDTETLLYGGHSQGSVVGGMVGGVEPEIDAFAFNGLGSYLSINAVERKDPFDIAELIATIMGTTGDIDIFHPIIALAQLGADVVDSQNYARNWRGMEGRPQGVHVLMTNGMNDTTTHFTQMNTLTIAGDLAPIAPAGWEVDPFGVWDREEESTPISANRTSMDGSPLTFASYLHPGQGHYTIYRDERGLEIFVDFLVTAAFEDVPTIP